MTEDEDDWPVTPLEPSHRGRCGKVSYPGEASAKRARRAMQRHGKAREVHGSLHVYLCPVCRRWHVGHSAFW